MDSGTVSHFELTGRQLQLYLTDIKAGKPYSYTYSLLANMPIKATIQGVNALDMHNPMLNDVEEPVQISRYESN